MVRLDNPDSDMLESTTGQFFLDQPSRRGYIAESVRRVGGGNIRLSLAGISSREEAEALRGGVVFVAEENLPPPQANEFYAYRVLGCEVITTDGRTLGRVAEVLPTGANDVLVVHDGAAEVLIPVIADVVKALDFDHGRIVVDPVPGLLGPG